MGTLASQGITQPHPDLGSASGKHCGSWAAAAPSPSRGLLGGLRGLWAESGGVPPVLGSSAPPWPSPVPPLVCSPLADGSLARLHL